MRTFVKNAFRKISSLELLMIDACYAGMGDIKHQTINRTKQEYL